MTITEPTTTGADSLVELPLDRLAPHPRNIRRHSDVTDLARSIACLLYTSDAADE